MKSLETRAPLAEVYVEGELSPFEHEALYRLLKRHFQLEQPVYSQNPDENIVTRVTLTFHHSYDQDFFLDIIREDWRELKELFRQVSYRRGRLGASFNMVFQSERVCIEFSTESVSGEFLGSALDQLGHLTGIIGQISGPERMVEPLSKIEIVYDKSSDRWRPARGIGRDENKGYSFDESLFKWKPSSGGQD